MRAYRLAPPSPAPTTPLRQGPRVEAAPPATGEAPLFVMSPDVPLEGAVPLVTPKGRAPESTVRLPPPPLLSAR